MRVEDIIKRKPELLKRPTGVRVRHTGGWRNQLYVIENRKRPYGDGGFDCNLCIGVHHAYKASHLWLEDDGGCLVSVDGLEELKRAGMPNLEVVGITFDPPPTGMGRAAPIPVQRKNQRAIHVLGDINQLAGRASNA